MDLVNLSESEILKMNKEKLQKCILDIKNNIPPGMTIKDLILNSFNEIKNEIKELKDEIKDLKETSSFLEPSIIANKSQDYVKLEKSHHEPEQYTRRNNVEILGIPDIFSGEQITEKVIELCNDVGVPVKGIA